MFAFSLQGDPVEEFQPLCEVQSDKATIEITSRFKGKVALISHAPGDIIKVREAYKMTNSIVKTVFKAHSIIGV